ncbi:octopamine receptor-like [Lytechinus pictus]|uniref:octopamine receptor-like n=1 Tax=Lytechinus pictus TaxID=7653 RepID=UPI00240DFC1D|nr:octopamine receptor-like [Lytechinus pictus]
MASMTTEYSLELDTLEDDVPYNSSDYVTGMVTPLYISLIFIIHTPLWILTVFGNSLVVLAVFRERNLRQPTYALIATLAVTDLIFPLFGYPPSIYAVIVENRYTCSIGTRKYFFVLTYTCAAASFFHIIAITFERYIGVLKPLRYHDIVTMKRIVLLEVFIWLMSLLIGASAVLKPTGTDTMRPDCKEAGSSPTFSFVSFILLTLGFLVITLIYLHIYRIARGHWQDMEAEREKSFALGNKKSLRSDSQSSNDARQFKATKTIGIIIVLFVICWLPTATRYFFEGIGVSVLINWTTWIVVKRSSETFWLLNGAINPLVYARRNLRFRNAFKDIIKCLVKRCTCSTESKSRECYMSSSKTRPSLSSNITLA